MAITIIDQPTAFAKVGQKLIVVASSTNVGEDNFRFVVKISNPTRNVDTGNVIIPPNPNNRLMFNIPQLVKQWVDISIKNDPSSDNHLTTDASCVVYDYLYHNLAKINITIKEGYDVDGVFTIDDESQVDINDLMIFNASYKVIDGYKPDPNLIYSFTGTTSKLLGGRTPNTHIPTNYPIGAATTSNQIIWIPVRRSELDYGSIQVIMSETAAQLTTTNDASLRMTIYNSSGAPTSASFYPFSYADSNDNMFSLMVYPANLNGNSDLLKPSDFPNWRWYDIAMYDSTNTTRKSCIYRFYPIEDDCRFDNIRLAWWHPEIGGFDFFNFSKKNEESIEVDRKRVKKVVGTYNASTFSFNTYDRELAEGMVNRVDYINITSDWLQEGEFELLKSLIASQAVWIVKDDGTQVPVLVEEANYTARKIREAKQYNYSMRLRYSQQFM